MRVVQINCVYKNGSTGKIVYDLHTSYRDYDIDSHVIYGRGKDFKEANSHKCASEALSKTRNIISRISGNLYGMGYFGTRKIIRLLNKIKPDVVHLHCINGFFCDVYALLNYLREKSIPTVVTLHAEFMYTGNCGYSFECDQWKNGCRQCADPKAAIGSKNKKATALNWLKMKKAFEGFDDNLLVAGVSDWISDRARQSAILSGKRIITILNGLNDTVFNHRKTVNNIVFDSLTGKKVILFVTPYFEDENKGGKWVIELAERLKDKDYQILVVGDHEKEYTVPNITFLGRVNSQEQLADLYSKADICLLVSRRETFSMVTAESLCCGTPVVGFEAGAPELIAIPEYSEFVPYGDLDALESVVFKWLRKDIDKELISRTAVDKYSSKTMAENYLKAYRSLLD